MARTKADNYDSKRDAITTKAAKLFAAKGFGGASISDISKACGVSKSLIYHYYAAKEDILFGVMEAHIDDIMLTVSNDKLTNDDARIEFHQLTGALLKCYAGAENAQKVLLYELNNLTRKQRKIIIAKQRKIIGRFEDVYAKLYPHMRDDPGLLRSKIMLFFGMVNWVHTWFNPKGEITREDIAKMASDTVLK